MEIHILDMIQNLRTPIGDVVVPLITRLGDAGIIWIILTLLLLWKIALVLAVLIALSRLYLYVHYPTDIIGGVIFGSLSGYLGYKIVGWIQKKKTK